MIKTKVGSLFVALLAACSPAQGKEQDQEKARKDALRQKLEQQMLATFAKEEIGIDRKKKTITVPVVVNAPENELEFLLINPAGKKHESLLICRSKPSILNAAFVALGYKKGQNVSFKPKKPAPSREEQEKGVDPMILVPPSGMQVWMTVQFEVGGKKKHLALEELLLDWEANLSVTDHKWLYLGGRLDQLYRNEPEVFMADYEGNLVSTCYRQPANQLITLEHARARDDMNWSATAACPKPGTEMKLTFHMQKPVLVAAYEARMAKVVAARKKKGKDVDKAGRKERKPARGR